MGNSPFRRCIKRDSGFTLVELLVTMAIAVILLAVGIPSFAGLLRDIKLTSAANDFFSSIHMTRSEALRRGARVDMTPLDPGGDWAKGWVVFVDKNGNQKLDSGERAIFSHGPVSKGIQIKAALTDSTVQYLAYNEAGRTRTNASGYKTQFGTFTFEAGSKVRKIKLNFLGRPRVCNPEIEKNTC
ncbi:prepilin-type N-terminal cleavage/methylation domain-containing protein [Herbaspirillum sp. HC18]|nr:prepilin-type N-terminal cleavage/methylation domain-containing protein [Herbaspirillum sp. HC18]